MKRPLPVVTLMLLVVSVALSGCVSESPQVTGRGTPVWQPGYTWVYETTSEHTFRTQGEREAVQSGRSTQDATHRVVATEPTIDEPVYWLRITNGDIDAPLLEDTVFGDRGGLVALSQVDLSPRAHVSEWDLEQCGAAVTSVRAWPAYEPFRMLAFPLDEGESWQGGEDEFRYVATVAGTETVSVPAGPFDAVRIDYALTFQEDEDAEYPEDYREEVSEFQSEFTVWYSPAVKNVVKIVSSMSAHIKESEEEFDISMSTEILLKDHSLQAEEPEALPEIIMPVDATGDGPEMIEIERHPYRIVSDHAFPLNAAELNGTVTFGIADGGDAAGGVPETPVYDTEKYQVHWRAQHASGTPEADTAVGPTLSFTPTAGRYWIEAELVPAKTSAPTDGSSCMVRPMFPPMMWIEPVEVEVFWMKSYDIKVKTGETDVLPLETLTVGGGHAEIRFDIEVTDTYSGLSDDPELVFKGPQGVVERSTGSGSFIVSDGEWSVEWHPNGPGAGLGQGRPFGHSATVEIELRY
ncbi:MAG: hypothetical protein KY455_10480 [Euryarchaeota archaeon]|nr:hypothetical protein [Euryarchaeota archaeon]